MGKQTKSSQQKLSKETQTLDLLGNIHKSQIHFKHVQRTKGTLSNELKESMRWMSHKQKT